MRGALKPGYKQTEVGVIPEDWACLPLNALVAPGSSITYGIVQAGPHVESGVPYIKTGDMSGRVLPTDGLSKTSREIAARYPRSTLRTGELVYSIRASVGAVHCVPPELDGANLTQGTARIAPNPNVFPLYLLNALRSAACQSWIDQNAKGSTYREITLETLRALPVPIPPTLAEQEAIAEALSDADALIESLEQLIAKKRQIKQGAMQELLTGRKRLPGFIQGELSYRPTKFGMMPIDWQPTPLQQISAFITKGSTPTTYGFAWQPEGVLFLRSECVSEHGLDLSQSMFISGEAHQVLRRSEVRAGDILMTITGNVGRVVHLQKGFGEANINQHIARIRIVHEEVAAPFVFHFLCQPVVRRYYNLITTGQAYPQISLTQVRETEMPMPSLAEQTAIATILTDMDAETAALEEKLAKACQLKQGMMQELLTGRTRLMENGERFGMKDNVVKQKLLLRSGW